MPWHIETISGPCASCVEGCEMPSYPNSVAWLNRCEQIRRQHHRVDFHVLGITDPPQEIASTGKVTLAHQQEVEVFVQVPLLQHPINAIKGWIGFTLIASIGCCKR